jgi:hypothetical protein
MLSPVNGAEIQVIDSKTFPELQLTVEQILVTENLESSMALKVIGIEDFRQIIWLNRKNSINQKKELISKISAR